MGNRLHYETKHVIEYSPETIGNWNFEEIDSILSKYDVEVYTDENAEDTTYCSNFYCNRCEIEKMVDKLRRLKPDANAYGHSTGFDYTNKEVADFFENALKLGEQNSDYVYFSWF